MSLYYISACHDCKEWVMWAKATEKTCKEWHDEFHAGHDKEFGHDYDDEFYDKVWKYKDLGIQP